MKQNERAKEQEPKDNHNALIENYLKKTERNIVISKLNLAILLFLIVTDGILAIRAYILDGPGLLFFVYLILVFVVTFTFGYVQLAKENMELNKSLIPTLSEDIQVTIYHSLNKK